MAFFSLSKIPRAIDEECPIDPTVKKSFWLIPKPSLISYSSLDVFPVVDMKISSSEDNLSNFLITSSLVKRAEDLWFFFKLYFEKVFFLTSIATGELCLVAFSIDKFMISSRFEFESSL